MPLRNDILLKYKILTERHKARETKNPFPDRSDFSFLVTGKGPGKHKRITRRSTEKEPEKYQ